MTSPFDAYDLMRRSILSSILGLKRKPRVDHSTEQRPHTASCSSTTIHHPTQQEEVVRTPHDIYREIVVECEQIERSRTSSPLSDFETSPSSNRSVTSTSTLLPTGSVSPSSYPVNPFVPEQADYPHMLAGGHFSAGLPPPPYSSLPPVEDFQPFSEHIVHQPLEQAMLIPQQIKQDESMNAFSIEEIVKMVVTAMKMKNCGMADAERESPEEVLRRKRQQNNLAAARYRKRQREARDMAEDELDQLMRRNENLRQTVERMQLEIDELKRAVLSSRS